MIITFFGHSNYESTLEDEERLIKLMEAVIKGNQVDFYLGGYGAFNTFALHCARKYKKIHPNAKLIFITPYLGSWLDTRKDIINNVFDSANFFHSIVCDIVR